MSEQKSDKPKETASGADLPPQKKEELTKEELQNLRLCCIKVAKMADTNDTEMKYLLILSDKIFRIMNKESVDFTKNVN